MDATTLLQLLEDVRDERLAPDDALARLRRLPFADLGVARVDHHRALRQGMGEAIYGPGKSPEQVATIVGELLDAPGGPVVLSRADGAQVKAALTVAPEGVVTPAAAAELATVIWRPAPARPGRVVVVTAGTADLAVAGEALAVLGAFGLDARLLADCGVAGLHRLLAALEHLESAQAVIVVAGMEGALASVVGGLTPAPVVAVPTSVGYGTSLAGVTALLAMLSSCAAGITVVGIDNGYGAACAVSRLLP